MVASWCGRGGSRGGREGLGGVDCKMRCRRRKEESGGRSDNKRGDRTKETLQIPFTVWEYNRLYKSLYLSLLVTMISTSKEHGFQYAYESRWSMRSRMVVPVVRGGVHVALLLDAGGGECASRCINGSSLR